MLAVYSSLVKKEDLIERIRLDAENLANMTNDLVCELKVVAAACKSKDAETLLSSTEQAENLSRIVGMIATNVRNNSISYINSLIPKLDNNLTTAEQNQTLVEDNSEEKNQNEQQDKADPAQITSILEAIKSLKEMKNQFAQ